VYEVKKILEALKKEYPSASIALNYKTSIQLLVAVVLSAQCTDKKVNEVTEKLFKKYKTVEDFAVAKQNIFEREIKSTGFYRAKAKNIIAAADLIKKKFKGKIPNTMEEITQLPGVARKSANVILGNLYGVIDGIAVDTHVKRFTGKCHLSTHNDPNKIEQDLMKLFPKKEWFKSTYRIIEHGRSLRFNKKEHAKSCSICAICPDFIKK
jgi:endonuclease III